MNILKRQLALLLVVAMTLTMLPMPAHADEVTEPESLSAIVEESTEKPQAPNEEISADTANKPVEKAESDTAVKENTVSAAEAPVNTSVDSNTTTTEELIADVSKAVIDTDDTTEDAKIEENTESDPTVDSVEDSIVVDIEESEDAEDSEDNIQEETDQVESETDVLVAATFSFSRSVANAVADECEHPETEVAWDTKDQVINCKPISDTQHQISGYQYHYCTSCYERVGESFAVTEVGNHELDANGRCGMCGYNSNSGSGSGSDSDPNPDCDHANTAIGWDPDQLGPWYAQFSDTQHKVTGYRYTYCTDFGERIRDENGGNNNYYSEELDGHSLNASGECTLCGYGRETQCGHYNTEWSDSDDISHYEQFDENTHYTYRFRYAACVDCGESLEETAYSIRNESHVPENGVCIHCGFNVGEDYCAHSERDVAWDTNQTVTYNKYNDTHHKVTGYQYTYCTSCFDRVGESFAAEEYEEHTLNASGNCSLCGYAPSNDNGCAHKNTEEKFYFNNPVRYAQFNEDEHYIYRTGTIYCHDCRTDIGSSNTEMWSFEAHTLNDEGNCVYCGYGLGEGYCTHPNSRVIMDSEQEKAYYQKDEGQHLVNFYQYHYCPDCNSRISESFLDAAWEDHDFDASGVCTLCGEVRVCSHPSDAIENVVLISQYIIVSDTQHQKLGSGYPYCTECNTPVGESYPIEERENHVPNESGVCTLCSYDPNCKHENVIRSKPAWFAPRYSQFNATEHWVYRVVGVACVDCDTNLPNEEESSLWPHVLNDAGVCTYCGYGSDGDYCTHPTTAMAWDSGTTWEPFDDATHIAEGYRYHYCTVCSERISESSYWVDASEEHVLNGDGVCTICGFGAPCAHESMETVTSTQLVNQSLTHHTVETTTYEECTICHEKRNEVTDEQWVEHTPIDADSYGHEAAHPHKKYFICECGSHPYLDGEYHTANGKVQDESVCCICHDHKYGTEEETPEGTRQKTCTNCGISTVTHTHAYEQIQTIKLINPNETEHFKQTTTEQKCKTCGHTKNRNVETIKELHSPKDPQNSTYRTAHPHQRYAVCECDKEFNVPGEYEKVNGKLLEPDVCCICHGHKYGEAQEAVDGTWKKTCANCGLSQTEAAPVQPTEPEEEKHIHRVSTTGKSTSGHPHTYDILCVCGEVMGSDTMFVADCCACIEHHIWGNEVMLPDGTFAHGCLSCGISEEISPSQQTQDLYNVIQMITYRHNAVKKYNLLDSDATTLWKAIAEKATDKLTDSGFVVTNETLNTFSENSSISGAFKAAYGELTRETWDEQQTDLWETLLLRMLTEYYEDNADSAKEYKKDANTWLGRLKKVSDKTGDILSDDGTYKELEKSISYVDEFITGLEMQVTVLYNEGKNTDALAVQEELQYFKDKKKAYEDEIASAKATGADFKKSAQGIGLLMDCISVIAEGTSSAQAVAERNDAFAEMLIHSDQCIAVLENVYASAVSVGNYNLADAADKIKEELKEEKEKATNQFLTETGAFFKGAAVEIGKKGLSKGLNWIIEESAKKGEAALGTVVKDAGSILKVLGMSAKGLRSILDWGGAYDAAQKLMTINQMDASMNITQVLKNNESPYMIELWGLLQTEGCEHAQAFLNAWEDGTGLNSTDLGIDNGGLFGKSDLPRVLKDLGIERNYYITALRLPLEKSK